MHIASAPADREPASFITMSSTFSAISQSVSHIVPNSDECCNLSINAMKIYENILKLEVCENQFREEASWQKFKCVECRTRTSFHTKYPALF